MAAKIVCDRCGRSGDELKNFVHVKTHKLASATTHYTRALEEFDLCNECCKEFFKIKESEEK